MDIKSIFFEKIKNQNNRNIIKTVKIDRNRHANGIFNLLLSKRPEYVLNASNKLILANFLNYFSGCEKSEYNLNKGIALLGGVGTGKTLIFDVFKEYTCEILRVNSFRVLTSKFIIDLTSELGLSAFKDFNFYNNKPTTLYIDDVASINENVTRYGTKINAMEHFLSERYDLFKRYGVLTHLTSNKYPVELKELYGERLADRFKEMFNICELDCESFRK